MSSAAVAQPALGNGQPTSITPVLDVSESPMPSSSGGESWLPSLVELLSTSVAQQLRREPTADARDPTSLSPVTARKAILRPTEVAATVHALRAPTATQYLTHLLELPLPQLLGEPDKLRQRSASLETDLASLAYRSYANFIAIHEAQKGISTSFNMLGSSLTGLLSSISALSDSSQQFEQFSRPIIIERDRYALVLDNVTQCQELVEIPSMVRTCVRGGWWSEAMELAERCESLQEQMQLTLASLRGRRASLSGPQIDANTGKGALSVLQQIRARVADEILILRLTLLRGLSDKDLKLPGALRNVNLLRRMRTALSEADTVSLDEAELRLALVSSRWTCLTVQLKTLSRAQLPASQVGMVNGHSHRPEMTEDRLRYIKKWIEIWREGVGETVGMYTDVFLISSTRSNEPDGDVSTEPLAAFLLKSASILFEMLESDLQHIHSVSALSSLLTQLSYCSAAFARFGLDFVWRIGTLVQERVKLVVVERWQRAVDDFAQECTAPAPNSAGLLQSSRSSQSRRAAERRLAKWLLAPESRNRLASTQLPALPDWPVGLDAIAIPPAALGKHATNGQITAASHQPSVELTLFPPLARLLNGFLTGFNELRLLPVAALRDSLANELQEQLLRAVTVMSQIGRQTLSVLAHLPVNPPGSPSIAEEDDTSEETLRRREAEEDQRICLLALATFSRLLMPFLDQGFRKGIYGEMASTSLNEPIELAKGRMQIERLIVKLVGGNPDEL
ncbi:uncharacterized protein L969DRAFT_504710 [Mixia osmundae IAM 14324]|uniref:Conserved oligomeric Golgi complex subunit 8 n=1 Tax=Mixia osmundae (strain CBS 9802 / IAM 14324 / JCM 22182 / KY 12970) TaxID=764103 RepID=G7E6Z1_MIXOS|nr:uncharacterized protein L969DRAFT_504710 [Mixia osmundae IAM 14324]KEI39016.1 hypothetical protein L969DRAFT_504710 [Mixia osmundae IAM 14324]GAA98601.1 hypothetical protein E5Q_05288 [Mixia osmundae IAM 14324]